MVLRFSTIRDLTSFILVAGHLIAAGIVFIVLHDFFRSTQEKLEIVAVLSPITGLFAVAALRSLLSDERGRKDRHRVRPAFAIACVSIPLVFVVFINYVLLSYPLGVAGDPSSLRLTIAASEGVLGVMLGAISEKLFGVSMKELREEVDGDLQVNHEDRS